MKDYISKAAKVAIKNAKFRKSPKVSIDDLLVGVLQVISRFEIVKLGHLIIDLRDLDEFNLREVDRVRKEDRIQKVTYSSSVNDLLEQAAHIASADNSPKIQIVHVLAAFAHQNSGLMGKIMKKNGFSGKDLRVALVDWEPFAVSVQASKGSFDDVSTENFGGKIFFNPDEAADFLSVHVQTIRGYIRTGKLPALRLAGERALRIKLEDLLALLEPFKP